MARGLSSTIKNLLAANSIRYFDLIEIEADANAISTLNNFQRFMTNGPHDITLDTATPTNPTNQTYVANGMWLGWSAPSETGAPLVNTSVVTLSASDSLDTNSTDSIWANYFLNYAYIGKNISIYRQFMDPDVSPPSQQGDPLLLWQGEVTAFKIQDGTRGSQIDVTTTNVFYDFELVNCRRTNSASQAATKYYVTSATNKNFANDKGFEFATQDVKDLTWGKKI